LPLSFPRPRKADVTRTFWMSFADEDGFRGACVIEVDAAEAAVAKADIDVRFPRHAPDAEWMAAAMTKAWQYGCNPGGQVQFAEIEPTAPIPRNRLLQEAEVKQWTHPPVH
jgi:hypothetical protein